MQKETIQSKYLKCGEKTLNLSRPAIMGVLNVTPDSFSDGGQLFSQTKIDADKVLYAAETMVNEGADIIDLGGESTRPGAAPVTVQQELDRVIPVLELLCKRFDVIFSVDTSTAEVMLSPQRRCSFSQRCQAFVARSNGCGCEIGCRFA